MTKREIAEAFSRGDFEKVWDEVAQDIRWNMYEEADFINGKDAVRAFTEKVGEYFRSVATDFRQTGVIDGGDTVAVYGKAAFIRDGKTVNRVDACDVYEFDGEGKIAAIHSYCNSKRPAD